MKLSHEMSSDLVIFTLVISCLRSEVLALSPKIVALNSGVHDLKNRMDRLGYLTKHVPKGKRSD